MSGVSLQESVLAEKVEESGVGVMVGSGPLRLVRRVRERGGMLACPVRGAIGFGLGGCRQAAEGCVGAEAPWGSIAAGGRER